MSRDLVLAALVFCVGGWLMQLGGAVPLPVRRGPASGASRERRLWRRLWSPVLPAFAASDPGSSNLSGRDVGGLTEPTLDAF